MKFIFIISLFVISACSSNRAQNQIPPFQKEKVCSDESLAFLKKKGSIQAPKKRMFSDNEIHSRLQSLEPSVRKCYEEEMERTNKPHAFNLCLVMGYNKKGVINFFEFSSNEIEMSSKLKSCLSGLKNKKELQGLKDLAITQPFRLFPKW